MIKKRVTKNAKNQIFIKRRKELLISLNDLVLKRIEVNKSITDVKQEMRSLDTYLLVEL